MRVIQTRLPGALVLEPSVFRDERGHFLETWSERRYAETGIPDSFVQDNASVSHRGVLRGLHFQDPFPQAKLVSVLDGEVWDVAVDLRHESPTFGEWKGVALSAGNARQFYLPEGFAHGFVVLSERAVVSYKCSEYYHPEAEHTLRWDDADVGIRWPVAQPVLSARDVAGRSWREVVASR